MGDPLTEPPVSPPDPPRSRLRVFVHATGRKDPCVVPPAGWSCSRDPGHEGPCAARPGPRERHWGDVGFRYVKALAASGLVFRALAMPSVDLGDSENRWHPLAKHFATEFDPDNFINIIISGPFDADRLWTANVHNVLITGLFPDQKVSVEELRAMERFQSVYVIDAESQSRFNAYGVYHSVVEPHQLEHVIYSLVMQGKLRGAKDGIK